MIGYENTEFYEDQQQTELEPQAMQIPRLVFAQAWIFLGLALGMLAGCSNQVPTFLFIHNPSNGNMVVHQVQSAEICAQIADAHNEFNAGFTESWCGGIDNVPGIYQAEQI